MQTDGVDAAATVHRRVAPLGRTTPCRTTARSIEDNYTLRHDSGADRRKGPFQAIRAWLNKFIVSANYGPFEAQVSGDYVGKRYATYTNDQSVPSYFLTGLEASYRLPLSGRGLIQGAKFSINVTNLADVKGVSAIVVGSAAVSYGVYPLPPRMVFGTLTAEF